MLFQTPPVRGKGTKVRGLLLPGHIYMVTSFLKNTSVLVRVLEDILNGFKSLKKTLKSGRKQLPPSPRYKGNYGRAQEPKGKRRLTLLGFDSTAGAIVVVTVRANITGVCLVLQEILPFNSHGNLEPWTCSLHICLNSLLWLER